VLTLDIMIVLDSLVVAETGNELAFTSRCFSVKLSPVATFELHCVLYSVHLQILPYVGPTY